jgi:hypothetical protein
LAAAHTYGRPAPALHVTSTEKVIFAVSLGVALLSAIALVLLRNPDGRFTRWIERGGR